MSARLITRGQFVAEARTYLGTPFHHGQSLKQVGCDCIGVIVGVAAAFGLPEAAAWRADSRFAGYGRTPRPDLLSQACAEYLDPVPVALATLADVLLFTFRSEPMHFGIISRASPRYVIHGYERVGKVVENGADATFWRVLGAFRVRGVY